MRKIVTKLTILSLLIPTISFAYSIDKAIMLNDHGLKQESKTELIAVIFSRAATKSKAHAYYLLGGIAFDENKISTALESWTTLSKKYPKSRHASLVKDRIKELSEIVGESAKESIENVVALSYLRHGDFWSKGKDSTFTIDSSWIPKVESATKWYDKVISEFPNSTASKIAYQDKIRTILGWKDRGKYGSSHGIKESFVTYIPILLETFKAFEKEHPNASTLQAFRYQIAQTYWSEKDFTKTKEWLNKIITVAGEGDSFYKDTAQRRLLNVEY